MHNMLQVSDPYVLRQLVNTASIESTLLAPTRAEADRMLRSLGTGGMAMAADLFRVVRFGYVFCAMSLQYPLIHRSFTGRAVECRTRSTNSGTMTNAMFCSETAMPVQRRCKSTCRRYDSDCVLNSFSGDGSPSGTTTSRDWLTSSATFLSCILRSPTQSSRQNHCRCGI